MADSAPSSSSPARTRPLCDMDRMAPRAAEQGAIQPPPASAAATADPVRLRRRLLPAPPSSPTGAMENGLPDDPLAEILSRFPAKSLCRFKCVSKPWRDLIAGRPRCRKFPQTLQGFIYGDGEAHAGENYGHFINLLGKSSPLIDPSFAFLTKLPWVEKIVLLGSCNGLLLFGHRRASDVYDSLGYIVCNPATEQWVAVPSSGWCPWPDSEAEDDEDDFTEEDVLTHLVFDPAVSPHFQLIQLWQKSYRELAGVHTYSSETGVWRANEAGDWKKWGLDAILSSAGCPFNGMVHLKLDDVYERRSIIVAVDGEGKTSRIIRWTEERGFPDFVGQSHGHLYCISGDIDDSDMVTELSIWVLEDYHTEEWVLKHSVSILQLFGKTSCRFDSYEVVTIHPDRDLVFFVEYGDRKLMSYEMGSNEVCDVCTLGRGYGCMAPYLPYFSDLSVLNKH
ncbi:unnamed protein product [Urochloa humidicola]